MRCNQRLWWFLVGPASVGFLLLSGSVLAQIDLPSNSIPSKGTNILPDSEKPGADKKQQIVKLPIISSFNQTCLREGTLVIRGANFGAQKKKTIRVNNRSVDIKSWKQNEIAVGIGSKQVRERTNSIEIRENNKRVGHKSLGGCKTKKTVVQKGGSTLGGGIGSSVPGPASPTTKKALVLPDLAVSLQLRTSTDEVEALVTVRNVGKQMVRGYAVTAYPSKDARGSMAITGDKQSKQGGLLLPAKQSFPPFSFALTPTLPYVCASVRPTGKDARPANNIACAAVKQTVVAGHPKRQHSIAAAAIEGTASQFGAAVRNQRATISRSDDGVPEGAQLTHGHLSPASLIDSPATEVGETVRRETLDTDTAQRFRLNRLLVNGSSNQATVRPGQPVTISWDIREIGGYAVTGNPIQGIRLGLTESPRALTAGTLGGRNCSPAALNTAEHLYSHFAAGGARGSHTESFSSYDFHPGTTYYLQGCATGGPEFDSGVETNTVTIHYGWDTAAASGAPIADIEIRELNAYPTGRRGASIVEIAFGIQPGLRYRSEFTLRNLDTPISIDDSTRAGISDEIQVAVFIDDRQHPTVQRYPGVHRLLSGERTRLSIDYLVPEDGQRHLIRVFANSSHIIPERDFHNNSSALYAFHNDRGSGVENADVRIRNVEVVDQTPSSAWVQVRANDAGFNERITVWFSGLGTRVNCTSGQDSHDHDPARRGGGVVGEYRFLCGVSFYSPGFTFDTNQLIAEIRSGGFAHRATRRFDKHWVRNADTMLELPDLGFSDPIRWRFTRAPRGTVRSYGGRPRIIGCGSGGSLTIRVTNSGLGSAPANRGRVELRYDGDWLAAGCRGEASRDGPYWTGGFNIEPLNAGETREYVVTVPADQIISNPTTIEVVLDAYETVPESYNQRSGLSLQTNTATIVR